MADLDAIRTRWAPRYDGANQDATDVLDLCAEVERLRLLHADACEHVDLAERERDQAETEVERLRDGIRQHREAESREWGPVESRPTGYEPEDEDLALWALIDDQETT